MRIKTPLVQFDGYDLVTVEFYGDPEKPLDLVINCPHGYSGKEFLETFPQVRELFSQIPNDVFHKYLSLEMDFGEFELAKVLAEILSQDLNIAVLYVQCDRGILDGNRIVEYAVRRIFDHEKHPRTRGMIREMSEQIATNISEFTQNRLAPHGFFLDLHTMWPTSQRVSPQRFESAETLEKYVDLLLDYENQEKNRCINFLLSNQEEEVIADKKRTEIITKQLEKDGFCSVFDEPYFFTHSTLSAQYYQFFPGVSIDLPRNFLGKPKDIGDPWDWAINQEKIETIAGFLSTAILNTFEK